MNDQALLPRLVGEQFKFFGSAQLSRPNAAKLIASHGEAISSDFHRDPPGPLVAVRRVGLPETVR